MVVQEVNNMELVVVVVVVVQEVYNMELVVVVGAEEEEEEEAAGHMGWHKGMIHTLFLHRVLVALTFGLAFLQR